MKIYNYDNEGIYINEGLATLCPITKKDYILPSQSTEKKPPLSKIGFERVFDNNKWLYVEDNRGQKQYNTTTKEESIISHIGATKEGFTLLKPNEFDIFNGVEWLEDLAIKKEVTNSNIYRQINEKELSLLRPLREVNSTLTSEIDKTYSQSKIDTVEQEIRALKDGLL